MNALNVGTPPSTRCGRSATGSSCVDEITALSPTSTAESPDVAASHSARPVRSDRAAAGDEPVPGLLNDRNVVVPPNAAATESLKNRSGSSSLATRVCVCTSTTPGSTNSPAASTTSRALSASPPRSGSTAVIRPPSTATSARDDPATVTTVPPRTSRSVMARPQPSSTISMSWAPSHRQRRPTSRSRSSQPSSGRTVAKWLPASWPTFDDVVHAPYGKKISHSLIPPG